MGLEPPRIPSPITLCLGEENGARFFAQVALLCLLKVVGTPGHSPQGQVYPYFSFLSPPTGPGSHVWQDHLATYPLDTFASHLLL